ncbi:MAG: alanine--tRNA ligase, partial [Candidatus Bathyarchaeota archaeon]
MKPYPIVARWRDDLYLTSASIVDFQPYVTNGIIPPPANPLVISQPCIRLVDIANTGPTFGRHLTIFEMGGHHAFNYPDKTVYWKDETVKFHNEYIRKELGVASEEVTYKEDVWSGGGNGGPSLETIVGGLELDTLVFMKFKVEGEKFIELPIKTVDTGYGIERYAWVSQGTISGFHVIYGEVLEELVKMVGLTEVDQSMLMKAARFSGEFSIEKSTSRPLDRWEGAARAIEVGVQELADVLKPVEDTFAVLDHTKSLTFLLAEGVVPSNVREGYLARLLIRRTQRKLQALGIEDSLNELVEMQIKKWSRDFPYLRIARNEILQILKVEKKKFQKTLFRGNALVKRAAKDLKSKQKRKMPSQMLVELYDSHGLPPEEVRDTAGQEGIEVNIPQDFYAMIAERHLEGEPRKPEVDNDQALLEDLPPTTRLYYEDPYLTSFESKVLRVFDDKKIVLKKTAFYPEGGGQPGDSGHIKFNGRTVAVTDVQKVGNVIVHSLAGEPPQEGVRIRAFIDWNRRIYLMRAHTATHVVMGAARRVLGQHVWQTGTQKEVEQARLDISHYQRLTPKEVKEIEVLANEAVLDAIPVDVNWLPRSEAEANHGFRLYQGGAVPGKEIRVVKVGDWEVEACGGTHVKNTSELGFIKILHTERIQDGIERITYSTGQYALKAVQYKEDLIQQLSQTLNGPVDKLLPTAKHLLEEWKTSRRTNERLEKALAEAMAKESTDILQRDEIGGFHTVTGVVNWVSTEQGLASVNNELLKNSSRTIAVTGAIINNKARIIVSGSSDTISTGFNAKEIVYEPGEILGGGGSGSVSFAQAGGPKTEKIEEAIEAAKNSIGKIRKTYKRGSTDKQSGAGK